MNNGISKIINEIDERICDLQTDKVSLQERLRNSKHEVKQTLNAYILRIIDILDMLDAIQSSNDLNNENNVNARMIFKKVNKRLLAFLHDCDVKEIVFEDDDFQPGEVRVLEKMESIEINPGQIVKVCRKGYQQKNKIIRPADVITAI